MAEHGTVSSAHCPDRAPQPATANLTVDRQHDRRKIGHSFRKLKRLFLPMTVESFWFPFHSSASQMRSTLHDKEDWTIEFVCGADSVGSK